MKKILVISFIVWSVSSLAQAPTYVWAKSIGNIHSNEPTNMEIDLYENIYTIGAFIDTIDCDPSPAVFNLISPNNNSSYITKLDSSGNFLWAKSIDCQIKNLTIDSIGDFFVIGDVITTTDVDPSPLVYNINSGSFIAKYNSSGVLLWAKEFSASTGDIKTSHITLDKIGNIILSGSFYNIMDFDPNIGVFNLTSGNSGSYYSYYICKLSPTGSFIWAKSIDKNITNYSDVTVVTDYANNVCIIASFTGTIDVNPGAAITNFTTAVSYDEVFLCKLDLNGNFLWAKQLNINFPTANRGKPIVIDTYGNIFITGGFPSCGMLLSKYDANGTLLWANCIGSHNMGLSLAINKSNHIYVTGRFGGGMLIDFDPGPSVYNMFSNNSYDDVFVAEYDTQGSFLKATSFGGSLHESACSVEITSQGSLYLCGFFQNYVSLSTIPNIYLNSNNRATFVCKIKGFNTSSTIWPGDANSDGVADNLDVLELGLHYAQTGTPRATTSNLWQSYYAANWSGTITNGENINHSDCNGDGIINDNDTLAIFNNYNLTHAFKPITITTTSTQISLVPDQTLVAKGTWGTSSIYLGDATTTINTINGVAFTVNYDNSLLETDSVWIEYPTSFINASNQNLKFRKRDFSNGKLYTATTHTVNGNVNGYGKIATLHYKIKSTLITDNVLNLSISYANQSNAIGTITPLTAGSATLMTIGASVGLNELSNGNYISVHPNPTNGVLIVNSTTELQKVEVMAITGQLLMSEIPLSTNHVLHLDHLANGVYFVNLYQNNRIVKREKIILNK